MKISFVTTTFNHLKYLPDFFNSINYDFDEIIVLDNASTDGTREWLIEEEKKRKNLKLLLSDKNLGEGGSYNIVMNEAVGDFVIKADPDMILPKLTTPHWVEKYIEPFKYDRVGVSCVDYPCKTRIQRDGYEQGWFCYGTLLAMSRKSINRLGVWRKTQFYASLEWDFTVRVRLFDAHIAMVKVGWQYHAGKLLSSREIPDTIKVCQDQWSKFLNNNRDILSEEKIKYLEAIIPKLGWGFDVEKEIDSKLLYGD